jgi:hypothetical protein
MKRRTRRPQATRPRWPLKLQATLRLDDLPEVLAALRYEVAAILRQVAEDEAPPVAHRLRAIAAAFEAGQSGHDEAG